MNNTNELFNNAELALAAYAELNSNQETSLQVQALKAAGMSESQANAFSERYPDIVSQFTDPFTGFSATIFKSSEGELTLAIRGTEFGPFDLSTDEDILTHGAGYDQIIAMVNWWKKISAPAGTMVEQYELAIYIEQEGDTPPANAVKLYSNPTDVMNPFSVIEETYLQPAAQVAAVSNGNVYSVLQIDSDHHVDVTGHSLGAHLSLAFNSSFPTVTSNVTGFNTPGFKDNNINQAFFELMGENIPTSTNGSNVTNIVGNQTVIGNPGFSAIAGLHFGSNPVGQAINISIEDQVFSAEPDRAGALNHSQIILTDSLAVYNLLSQLDNNLNPADFDAIFQLSSNQKYKSLERIVDSFSNLFGLNTSPLPVGNKQREALYLAINNIQDNASYKAIVASGASINMMFNASATLAMQDNEAGRGYRYALVNLIPFAITSNLSGTAAADEAYDLENFSEQYLTDRVAMLQWLIKYNESDEAYGDYLDPNDFPDTFGFDPNITYTDLSSPINNDQDLVLKIDGDDIAFDGYQQIVFGRDDKGEELKGFAKDDRLYGGGGNDNLLGQGGNDYLEGGKGNDTMSGGEDNDIYIVDSQGDVIVENAGEGEADIIRTSVDYMLTEQDKYIEQVELDKTHDGNGLALTGNQYNNILVGNQLGNTLLGQGGHNILSGGKGDDILYGGKEGDFDRTDYDNGNLSNSTLYGGKGNDTYFISKGDSYEIIVDSDGQGEVYLAIDGIKDKSFKFTGGTFLSYEAQRDLSGSYSLNEYNDRQAQGYYDYWLKFDDVTKAKAIEAGLHNTEGMPIGLFVESEGNYTITVGNALFQIQEFYQGDLGITLEQDADGQGYDLPERADLDDIIDAIALDEQFDEADVARIKEAIKNAYEQSTIARKMLTDFVSAGNNININYAENGFYSFVAGNNHYASAPISANVTESAKQQGDHIGIDLNWLDNNTYISVNGKAVVDTLESALIHELVHFIKGFADTDNYGEKGDTVTFANAIYKEMGLPEQVSYHAYDDQGDTHVTNFEYSQGQVIDRAFTLIAVDNFDSTIGGELDDLIIGNERNNFLTSGDGSDFLYGEAGDDNLHGDNGDDSLYGGDGNDHLYGGVGHDELNGGKGNDELTGGDGDDLYIYSYGDGNDTYQENTSGIDTIKFTDIASTAVALSQQDGALIFSFAGNTDHISFNDKSVVGYGMDFFEFSDGVVWDTAAINTLLPIDRNANVVLYGDTGDNELIGLDDDDELYGEEGNDSLYGGAGNDALFGGSGDDLLFGSDGDDELYSGAGNDELIGGAGSDQFYGGDGDDLYIYSYGDGNDDYEENSSGVDTIKFTDITSTDIILSKKNGSLIFSFAGNTDQISFHGDYPDYGMDFFEFSDGLIWDKNIINTQLSTASDGNDFLYGDNEDNELNALDGDDKVFGEGGNDRLNGGAGDDLLSGDEGNDVYIFNVGSGKDEIIDSQGEDSIQFGEGITASDLHIVYSPHDVTISLISSNPNADDQILIKKTYPNNTIEKLMFSNGDTVLWDPINQIYNAEDITTEIVPSGYDNVIYDKGGDSFLDGTDENDLFIGRSGDNTYHINASAGHDVIEDMAYGGHLNLHGITDDQILAVRDGDDLVINISGDKAQSIRIVDQYIAPDLGINSITVVDSNPNNPKEIVDYHLEMSEEYELYSEWDGFGTYNMGFDDLFGPRVFGPRIQGTFSDDIIIGSDGNDIIDGGKGDDLLSGGKGNDTYNYDLGDGKDLIIDTEGTNKVKFGEAITSGNITVISTGGHLNIYAPDGTQVVIQAGITDDVSIFNFRFSDVISAPYFWAFEFSDGTTWEMEDILAHTVFIGTEGDDITNYQHLINGTTYDMGLGDDTIYGSSGDDTYLFNLGDGQDIFSDSKGVDKIVFGEGITDENLRITHDSTETHWIFELLDNNGDLTGDKITVENAYSNGDYQLEKFEFFDGSSMLLAEIQLAAETLYTELEQEVVTEVEGTSNDDELVGDESGNIINGYDGNDTLTGELGNDTLIGGNGNDTYLFSLGDGNDVIHDAKGNDTLRFGADITAENITVEANASDMFIRFSSGEVLTVKSWYLGNSSRIENITFDDGNIWDVTQIIAQTDVIGSDENDSINHKYQVHNQGMNYALGDGNDTLLAGGGGDVINGQRGNDILNGGNGNDTYLFSLGDGNDVIYDAKGNDTLRFGAGITAENITVEANASDMFIRFSSGEVLTVKSWYLGNSSRIENITFDDGNIWDVTQIIAQTDVIGSDENDSINHKYQVHNQGMNYALGDGNDTLLAGGGGDVINGQRGNDILNGGNGNDTYLFSLGDGNDVIHDTKGNDTLRFGAGITADNISVSANYTDMLIMLSDGYIITISNWYSSNARRIEQFEFADGTVWEAVDIISNVSVETNKVPISNQYSTDNQGELFSEISSIDSNLNLLIQSYSSFDDVSDESGLELEKEKYSIVLPVLENIM